MRKLVLCLLVLAMLPLTVAMASVEVATEVEADVDATAAVNCSGSCGGRTWNWTCPAGWQCWLNCTKNPPTWCWKPSTGEEQEGTVTTIANVEAVGN